MLKVKFHKLNATHDPIFVPQESFLPSFLEAEDFVSLGILHEDLPSFVVTQAGAVALATVVAVCVRVCLHVFQQLQSGAPRCFQAGLLE